MSVIRDVCASYAAHADVRSIAVVGNMPLAASAERARLIDDADLVVRVNSFRVDGDAPTVGTRTNVVFFHRGLRATRWSFEDYRSRAYLLVEPGRLHWEVEALPAWWPEDLGHLSVPNAEVTIPIGHELGYDARTEPRWPTTGTIAAWVMHRMFPEAELRLTGYSFLRTVSQQHWEHAAGTTVRIREEHQLDDDMRLMSNLLSLPAVRLLEN